MTTKKKVCFVTPIYLPANLYGSDNYVRLLAEEFAKKEFDVSIITSNALTPRYWYNWISGKKIGPNYEIINNIKVYRLQCNQFFFILNYTLAKLFSFILPTYIVDNLKLMSSGPYLIGLSAILEKLQVNIIHCSPAPLSINLQVVQAIKKMKRKPTFIFTPFFHPYVAAFNNSSLQYIFDNSDIVHVISKAEKKDIEKRFFVNKEKFKIIPLFLNITYMKPLTMLDGTIKTFKKTYNLENKKIILFAGIKGIMKGAVDVLFSVDALYKKNKHYILIAIGHSTIEWERAKKKIDAQCLLDFSYIDTKTKEIIFGACDIFCMPSKSETFGLVYLEAWHKKKPVIAASTEAVKEFIGDSGIFVEFGNTQDIIKAIKLIINSKSVAKNLGEKGFNKLMKSYTFSKVFPEYLTLFAEDRKTISPGTG